MSEFTALGCTQTAEGVEFAVKVVPGAARQRVVGMLGDALKIAVAAPPEDGRANQAVMGLLAEVLGVRAAEVEVVAGRTSPRKRILVRGIAADRVRERLADAAN